ncbi:small RNA-binding protein 11, chloroplastic [Eutrema salsugineum]|uniref:small RNA-binding protein 11, chloroplastic n=1 Tax=Eutrema salsugineum TaxID=72664 RepID=UPI000CECF7FA|nr:small RNA-binding protein 11, chloroplastic [Eutrema salsugineum]
MLNQLLYRSLTPSLLFSRPFSSTLFVKGISFSSTEETLTQAFSQYGQVLRVDVIMDKVRCRPKGFAYVTFFSKEEAAKALLELNGQLVDGRVVILDTTKAVKHNRPDSKPDQTVEGVPNSQNKVIPES